MDVKIGFVDSPRELAIQAAAAEGLEQQVSDALEQGTGVLKLQDQRGRKYLVRTSTIAYVEFGEAQPRAVGFAGA